MFGIGGPELIIIVLVALLFVGPEKVPTVVKTVSGGLRDLRRMANLAQTELISTVDDLVREVEKPMAAKPLPPPPPARGPAGPDLLAEPLLIKRRADVSADAAPPPEDAPADPEPSETTGSGSASAAASTNADVVVAANDAAPVAPPWPVAAPILSGWNSGTQPRTAPLRQSPGPAEPADDEPPRDA